MRIAICDDDPIELQNISAFIEEYFKSKNLPFNCRSFSSSTELANTAPGEFDLYLLDVLMPALNGIELAKEIRSFDRAAHIIFLTSSPEFAVESYSVKASNYLLKPVSTELLAASLDELLEEASLRQEKYVVLRSSIGIRKIRLSQIVYAEAQERRILYHLENGEVLECTGRFSSVCEDLLKNREFFLPHRSFLVNMSYISTIGNTDIQMQTGQIIPLAQRRLVEIKEYYLAYQMEDILG